MKKYEKIAIPESRVVLVKVRNQHYVYHILRYYRDNNGKPKNDRILIGKAVDDKGYSEK